MVFEDSYWFRNQEIISKKLKKSEVLTRPDPPKSGKIVTRPDPTRGSIRPVDNSVLNACPVISISGYWAAILNFRFMCASNALYNIANSSIPSRCVNRSTLRPNEAVNDWSSCLPEMWKKCIHNDWIRGVCEFGQEGGIRSYIVNLRQFHGQTMRFIWRIPFLVFSGILIGYIILLPPEIVFL